MVCLTDLEPEVVSLILELVDDTSPRSTRSVACVNRYLNEITKIISHRHKVIEVDGIFEDKIFGVMKSWIEDQTVLANIRSLTIKGWLDLDNYTHEEDSEDFTDNDDALDSDALHERRRNYNAYIVEFSNPLRTLLSKIGKLRHFDWNIKCSMPVIVLDALESYQPASKLRVFNFKRIDDSEEEPEPIERRLAHCSALTHIRTIIHGHNLYTDRSLNAVQKAFRLIVASAPRLEYAGFITDSGESTQDLELAEIQQMNDAFRVPGRPNESVKNLTLDGVEISKKTLDSWSTIVSLAALETVKFTRGLPTLDYFQCAAAMLPNLKELSLNMLGVQVRPNDRDRSQLITAIQNYIATCAPLQTLSLWSWMGIVQLQDMLRQHGSSLRSLHLHEKENAVRDSSRILSVEDIIAIRDACPNLRSLTFDLQRHDSKLLWDNDSNKCYYSELAQIKQLAKLEIYFDLGARYPINPNIPGPVPFYLGNHDDDLNEDTLPTSSSDPNTQTTNTLVSPAQINPTSSPSSSPPPAKRVKISPAIARSNDDDLKPYVQNVWTAIFGTKAGARHLDVKIGDWEARSSWDIEAGNAKRRFVVRPPERDDVLIPEVKMFKKNMHEYRGRGP